MRQRARPTPFTLIPMNDSDHAAANVEQLRLLREALEEGVGQAVAPVVSTEAAALPGNITTSDQAAPAASEVH